MNSTHINAFYMEPPFRRSLKFLGLDLIALSPIAIGTLDPPINQSPCGIAIGQYAGYFNQGECAIAMGKEAGELSQSTRAIALGVQAGSAYQGQQAIAIGNLAGFATQSSQAVAIGTYAGEMFQQEKAIAIGFESAQYSQGSYAIAVGANAGQTNQASNSIVLNATGIALNASNSGLFVAPITPGSSGEILYYNSGTNEILRGGVPEGIIPSGSEHGDYLHWDKSLGSWSLGTAQISLGRFAGENNQGFNAVALGFYAGQSSQQECAIAIGAQAGTLSQSTGAIAIGFQAGQNNQGSYAIAIGALAGQTNQPVNSVILNASSSVITTATQASSLYIHPIRNTTSSQVLFYEPGTKEVTYSDPTFSDLSLQTYTYAYFQARDAVLGKFMFTDCADKDAFYRLRVSEPRTLYEGNTIYNDNTVAFDNDVTANASISGPGNNACMTLTVNAGSTINQYAARQTHFYGRYQPGKSFLAMFSFCFGTSALGIAKRVGFYDVDNSNSNNPNNGVMLEYTTTLGLTWWIFKGDGSSQSVSQPFWNVDPLNGFGPSGITLNPLNNLLGFVDLEYLGVGRVRVGFFINGIPIICNVFNNNGFTVPYMNCPFLPVRYEVRRIVNTPTLGTSMTVGCCTILSEGGYEAIGVVRTFQSGELSISNVEIKYALAIRLTSTYPRATISPVSVEIVSDLAGGANIAYYSVYLWRPSSSAVPSSTTWTAVNTTIGGSGSMVEYSNPGQSGATDLYTQMINDVSLGGISLLVERGAVNSTSKVSLSVVSSTVAVAQSNIDRANRDIYLVVINNNSAGTNKKYTCLLTFREI